MKGNNSTRITGAIFALMATVTVLLSVPAVSRAWNVQIAKLASGTEKTSIVVAAPTRMTITSFSRGTVVLEGSSELSVPFAIQGGDMVKIEQPPGGTEVFDGFYLGSQTVEKPCAGTSSFSGIIGQSEPAQHISILQAYEIGTTEWNPSKAITIGTGAYEVTLLSPMTLGRKAVIDVDQLFDTTEHFNTLVERYVEDCSQSSQPGNESTPQTGGNPDVPQTNEQNDTVEVVGIGSKKGWSTTKKGLYKRLRVGFKGTASSQPKALFVRKQGKRCYTLLDMRTSCNKTEKRGISFRNGKFVYRPLQKRGLRQLRSGRRVKSGTYYLIVEADEAKESFKIRIR